MDANVLFGNTAGSRQKHVHVPGDMQHNWIRRQTKFLFIECKTYCNFNESTRRAAPNTFFPSFIHGESFIDIYLNFYILCWHVEPHSALNWKVAPKVERTVCFQKLWIPHRIAYDDHPQTAHNRISERELHFSASKIQIFKFNFGVNAMERMWWNGSKIRMDNKKLIPK